MTLLYSAFVAVAAGIGFRLIIRPVPPLWACLAVAAAGGALVWIR